VPVDFSLARTAMVAGESTDDTFGGIPAYMAPEPRNSLECLKHGPEQLEATLLTAIHPDAKLRLPSATSLAELLAPFCAFNA